MARREAREEVPRQPPQPVAEDAGEQDREHEQPEQGGPQPQAVQGEVGETAPPPRVHGYASRYRPRSHVLTRLSENVPTNSSMPTAKIVR